MNLASLLAQRAEHHGETPALFDRRGARTATFQQLASQVAVVAASLGAARVQSGHRILIVQPMSLELYAALLGTLSLGAVAVVPDLSMDRKALQRSLEQHPCDAFIGSPRAHLLRAVLPGVRRIPHKVVTRGWVPGAKSWPRVRDPAPLRPLPVDDEHPAVLTFTSGSTGTPKAAVRTHGFLLAQEEALRDLVDTGPGDTDLAFLPLFVLANLARGVASVLPATDPRRPASADPRRILDQAERHRITSVGGPPFALTLLAKEARGTGRTLDTLRWIHVGGGPVFPAHFDALQALAPQAEVVAVYGSTEAEPIAELPASDLTPTDRLAIEQGRGLLAGRPVEKIRVAILHNRWGEPLARMTPPAFERAHAPVGEAGEIVVTGPHVLKGYLDPADDAETKIHVGHTVWHRTGDGGRLTLDGRLWLLGRCAARIQDARGELWPLAVEAAARADPRIEQAALAAAGNRRILAVEAPAEALGDLERRLGWAQLDEIRRVSGLPMDRRHASKIDYPRLRRELEDA